MDYGSIYFKLLVTSGIASFVVGIVWWKDLWDGTLPSWALPVQAAVVLWLLAACMKWASVSNIYTTDGYLKPGIAIRLEIAVSVFGLGILHAPVVITAAMKAVMDAFGGMINPKSAVIVKKSYDLADMAAARHDYENALALYREERKKDPKDSEVRVRIGDTLATREKFEEAFKEFSSILSMEKPEEKDLVYGALRAADILDEKLDSANQAKQILNRALARNLSPEGDKAIRSRLSAYA